MAAAEEAVVGGKGAWVRGGEHMMVRVGDQRALALGEVTPEQKDDRLFPLVEQCNDTVGELLPADAAMACRHAAAHGQHRVEQQDAVLRPAGEIAALRRGIAEVVAVLLEDVDERRRRRGVPRE